MPWYNFFMDKLGQQISGRKNSNPPSFAEEVKYATPAMVSSQNSESLQSSITAIDRGMTYTPMAANFMMGVLSCIQSFYDPNNKTFNNAVGCINAVTPLAVTFILFVLKNERSNKINALNTVEGIQYNSPAITSHQTIPNLESLQSSITAIDRGMTYTPIAASFMMSILSCVQSFYAHDNNTYNTAVGCINGITPLAVAFITLVLKNERSNKIISLNTLDNTETVSSASTAMEAA